MSQARQIHNHGGEPNKLITTDWSLGVRYDPLSDQAVMASCDNEKQATLVSAQIRLCKEPWLVDVVQAYVSVAIFYDTRRADFFQVVDWLTHNAVVSTEDSVLRSRSHA